MKTRLAAISFGLAMAAVVFLLVFPVYRGFDGERPTHATMLQVNGVWVIGPLMLPALITLVPLVIRRQAARITVTLVLGAFVLISGFSIGLFYLPSAILMLLAACVDDSAKFRDLFW